MTRPTEVDVAIVGAGIGGLAAAVALLRQGRDVHVFEQAPALGEVGGAIVMRMGSADLHGLFQRRVPTDRLHLGATLDGMDDHGTHAELRFSDGTRTRANALIGADGIRSTVRARVAEREPVYAGLVVSRGVVPVEHLPEGLSNDRMRMWSKDNRTIMAVPMRAGREFAVDTVHFSDTPPADLWTATVEADELLADFADFAPDVTDMVRASRTPLHLQGVHEIDPFTGWSTDRITLLGDAAHAMNPSHGQGANNAIQDAGALARHLDGVAQEKVPAALAAYAAEREPVTKEIQLASRVRPSTPGLERAR